MTGLALAFDVLARDKASATLNKIGGEAEKTGGHISKMGLALAAGFAAAGAGAVAFGRHSIGAFTDSVASANGLRRVMGGTIDDASRLAFAGQQTGVSTDALATAFRTLETHLTRADKATKNVVTGYKYVIEQVPHLVDGHIKLHDVLKKVAITAPGVTKSAVDLGFAYKDAHGHVLPMVELLPKLAEKFHDMPDGAEKTALAVKLFGRAGTQMIPILNKGAAGLAELSKRSDELGLTLSGRDLDAVKQNAAAHRAFHAAVQGLSVTVGRLLLPVMTQLAVAANTVVIPALAAIGVFLRTDLAPVIARVSADFGLFLDGLRGTGGATDAFTRMGVVAAGVLSHIKDGIAAAKTAIGQFIDGATGARPVIAPSLAPSDKRDLIDPAAATTAQDIGAKARAAFDQVYAAITDHLLPALKVLGENIISLGGTIASHLLPVVGNLAALLLSMSGTLIPLAAAFIAVNAALNVGQSIVQTAKDAYDAYKGVIEALTAVKAFFITTTDAETGAVTLSGIAQIRATVAKVADAVATKVSAAATIVFTTAQSLATVATRFLTETVIAGTGALIASTASKIATVAATVASTAATVAMSVATGVARVAVLAWTAAQWLLNAALTANPIGLVIAAVALLVAGFVLLYRHSSSVREAVSTLWDWLKKFIGFTPLGALIVHFDQVKSAIGYVIDKVQELIGWLGRIHVPDISLPHIPGFAGGVRDFGGGTALVGEAGAEFLSLPRGATVTPHAETLSLLGNGDLVEEVRALRSDVRGLVADYQRSARAQYGMT